MPNDRKTLIRIAASLPKGSEERRTLLAELQKQSFVPFDKIEKVRSELEKLARKNLRSPRVIALAPAGVSKPYRIIVTGETIPSGPTIPSISDIGGPGRDSEKVKIAIYFFKYIPVEVVSQVGRKKRKEQIRNADKMRPDQIAKVCFFEWYSGLIRKGSLQKESMFRDYTGSEMIRALKSMYARMPNSKELSAWKKQDNIHTCPVCGSHRTYLDGKNHGRGKFGLHCDNCGSRYEVSVKVEKLNDVEFMPSLGDFRQKPRSGTLLAEITADQRSSDSYHLD